MRATSVLSEGFLQRHGRQRKGANLFACWDDDVEMTPIRGFAAATDVIVCNPESEPLKVPAERSTFPSHSRAQIDFIADDEKSWSMWYADVKDTLSQAVSSTSRFQLMLELTKADALSRKFSYALSFCSVCSVVCVCVIMLTVLSSFPIVGLRLAESKYGAVDLEMRTGGFAASAVSLNYTRVSEILSTLPPGHQQHSYRVDLSGKARKQSLCRLPGGTVQSLWLVPVKDNSSTAATGSASTSQVLCQETCVADYCTGGAETVAMVVVDPLTDPVFASPSAKHLGKMLRGLPHGSVMISAALSTALKVRHGDQLLLHTAIDSSLRHVFNQVTDHDTSNPHVLLSVRVGAIIVNSDFPDSMADYLVVFTPASFTALVVDAMAPSVPVAARGKARLVKPAEYATRIVFQMPAGTREAAYMQTSFVQIRARVQDWGTPITEKLGANQVTMETPLLSFLYTMQFFTSFVGLIISIIVLALALVSIILIYTLLSIGIETKTYELGIHRMIGFTRIHLVMLVFTNTYFFTLPAWLVGIVAGQVGYWIVRAIIMSYVAVPLGLGVSGSAVGWATLAGLGVPFIAALLPIRSLISMKLPDALNTSRGRGAGVIYRIQRSRSRETDLILFGIGFLGALSGFAMYSFFPTSLITLNYALMFYILFLVLFGMFTGLVILATNFERVMETAMRLVFMFWEATAVRAMVTKSLSAHRRRNRQTTIMYALSVGFLVFITVDFNIEVMSLRYSTERSRGSDVTLYLSRAQRPALGHTPAYAQAATTTKTPTGGITTYTYEPTPSHPENLLGMVSEGNGLTFADYVQLERDLYAKLGQRAVAGMTYRMAHPSGGNLFPVQEIREKTLGLKENYALSLCPVPPNFYEVVNNKFVMVSKYDTDVGRYGLTGGLYAVAAAERVVVATTTNRVFALSNFTSEFLFETRVRAFHRGVNNSHAALTPPTPQVLRRAGRAVAVMDSSPVFLMTKFPNNMGEVLMSLPAAVRHTGVPYLSCNVLSLSTVFLQLSSPQHDGEVEAFLHHWLSERHIDYTLRNLTSAMKDIDTVDTIFTVFLIVTQIVILIICFFSLMSSMTANVLDSSKEIGVLLCLGMSRMQVYRVYVWEAFILVISSGFMGLLVGMTVAETMLLQSAMFTQLFIPFPFPYVQLCIVFFMGLGSALAASISPVMYLLNLPSITHILRRVI
ncbi:FtsX-like permease family [Lotmaria passim]